MVFIANPADINSVVVGVGGVVTTLDGTCANKQSTMFAKETGPIPQEDTPTSSTTAIASASSTMVQGLIANMETLNLGTYQRENVSNVPSSKEMSLGRQLFDVGFCFMMSYDHELAALYFKACLDVCPHAALAHGFIALCHAPNYNVNGDLYSLMSSHPDDVHLPDVDCVFPSQHVADRQSAAAMGIIDEMKRQQLDTKIPELISDVEVQLLSAIRILTCTPGGAADVFDETNGRPYANAMRKVYQLYPNDPDVVYLFVESLMVLNAWKLYAYPSGEVLSPDVKEIQEVLERALPMHTNHPGLMHMYIHLSEMSDAPERALAMCDPLRTLVPHAGHLIHMPTHIDVLLGNYDTCIRSNLDAIRADRHIMKLSPNTAGRDKLYFGYIVHDFHMAIYGSILGGMEQKGMEIATDLNALVNETLFNEYPSLVSYLETYSATDIHVMIRFGRWNELLEIELPVDEHLMLYRTASVLYGRALACAMTGNIVDAKDNADRFDAVREKYPESLQQRILHNNSVADLLAIDAVMMRGEIAYRDGHVTDGLALLRTAVDLEDHLNFDEPWGKMQPVRHALGGLLLEQGQVTEAESVFRKDLEFHPRNPWALVGLIRCLEQKSDCYDCCCSNGAVDDDNDNTTTAAVEVIALKEQLRVQRQMEWADFDIVVPCECCVHPKAE